MKTITIIVNDNDLEKVQDLLQHLTYVKAFNVMENLGSGAIRLESFSGSDMNVRNVKLATQKKGDQDQSQGQNKVDEITLLSQPSLSEEWDSEEDARYDELYASKYLNNDVPKVI